MRGHVGVGAADRAGRGPDCFIKCTIITCKACRRLWGEQAAGAQTAPLTVVIDSARPSNFRSLPALPPGTLAA